MFVVDQLTAALISLVIGTLLGTELTRYLYKPRVFIRYRDTAPLNAPDGVHWTIKVANIGRTVASDCRGIIFLDGIGPNDILEAHDANPQEVLPEYRNEALDLSFPRAQILGKNYFRPISGERIPWACLGNPDAIDINPGITEQLDICKFQRSKKGNYIIFPSEDGWRRLRTRVKTKEITGKIMVCPSNEFPTVIHFRLEIDDNGESTFTPISPGLFQKIERVFLRRKYYFG